DGPRSEAPLRRRGGGPRHRPLGAPRLGGGNAQPPAAARPLPRLRRGRPAAPRRSQEGARDPGELLSAGGSDRARRDHPGAALLTARGPPRETAEGAPPREATEVLGGQRPPDEHGVREPRAAGDPPALSCRARSLYTGLTRPAASGSTTPDPWRSARSQREEAA